MPVGTLICLSFIPSICATLGARATQKAGTSRLQDISNYVYLSVCSHDSAGILKASIDLTGSLNVTKKINVSRYNVFEEFELDEYIGELTSIEIRAFPYMRHRFNAQRITIRYYNTFYKLHLNAHCLQAENYWTSANYLSIWRKKVTCQSNGAICDDNSDLFVSGYKCGNSGGKCAADCSMITMPSVTHIIFRNGITRYEKLQ